jgi:hypothetical protein
MRRLVGLAFSRSPLEVAVADHREVHCSFMLRVTRNTRRYRPENGRLNGRFSPSFSTQTRMVTKVARTSDAEDRSRGNAVHYLNRDHIIIASVSDNELLITTTAGHEITIIGSGDELAELV